jgi:tyrosyl-tRNA synthetase
MRDWDFQKLFDRGMLEDAIVRDELFEDISKGKSLTIYQGFDPTSPNLHVGHLLGLRVLRWFQLHGHRVILLIGDFTGRIGDPSGRPETRSRLTHEQVLENAQTYTEQFSRIFDLDGDNPANVQFNGRWLDTITLAEFIEIMDKFTVQQLLERNMFQERMKKNEALYLNEMIYPVLQGYDSVAMEVDAELGASDQLFNMMRGRDLVRSYLGKAKHVLTTPLLDGLDGRKMSKTYGNTVDLTEDPVPMFFKLTLVQDAALPSFMRLLTDRTDDEISAVEQRSKSEHNMIDARQQFAHDIVAMLYDEKAADEAQKEFERVVSEGEPPSDIPDISVTSDIVREGEVGLVDLLAASHLIQSKGDARRLVQQSGIRINGEVASDPRASIPTTRLAGALVKIGKRGYVRVRVR